MVDIKLFSGGLTQLGLPKGQAVFLAYAVKAGVESSELRTSVGSYGMNFVQEAVLAVQQKALEAELR